MPLYEFKCDNCRKRFTFMKPITAYNPKRVACPKCRSRRVRRVWTAVNVVTSKKS